MAKTITSATYLFGVVRGYGPTQWVYRGKESRGHRLTHLYIGGIEPVYPDQWVDSRELQRLAGWEEYLRADADPE